MDLALGWQQCEDHNRWWQCLLVHVYPLCSVLWDEAKKKVEIKEFGL